MRIYTFIALFLMAGCSSSIQRAPANIVTRSCRNLIHKIFYSKNKEITLIEKEFSSIGIEVEGSIPDDLSYEDLARMMVDELQKDMPDYNYRIQKSKSQVNILYEIGEDEYNWTIKSDPSLHFPDGKTGVEVTTPIIRNHRDLSSNLFLLAKLKSMGMRAAPDQAGIHIHYGLPEDLPLEKLLYMMEAFVKLEKALKNTFHTSPTRDYLKMDNLIGFISKLKQLIHNNPGAKISDDASNSLSGTRSIVRFVRGLTTFETRLFNSNMDEDVYKVTVDFTYRFINELLEGNPKLISYLAETAPDSLSISKVSEIVESSLHENITVLKKLEFELANALDMVKKKELPNYNPNVPRLFPVLFFKKELKKLKTDTHLAILADKIKNLSPANTRKIIEAFLKHEYLGEATLDSLAVALKEASLKNNDIYQMFKKMTARTDGTAYPTIIMNLPLSNHPSKILMEEIQQEVISDYRLGKIFEGLTERRVSVRDISNALPNILQRDLGEYSKKKLIIYFMSQNNIGEHKELLKELILKDSAFTPKDSEKLFSYIVKQGPEELESFGAEILNFLLKDSSYYKTHSHSFLNIISEQKEITGTRIPSFLALVSKKNPDQQVFNSILTILSKHPTLADSAEGKVMAENIIKGLNNKKFKSSSELAIRVSKFFAENSLMGRKKVLALESLTTSLSENFSHELLNNIVDLATGWSRSLSSEQKIKAVTRLVKILEGINKFKFASKQELIHQKLTNLKELLESAEGIDTGDLFARIQKQLDRDEKANIREQLARRRGGGPN